VVYEATVTEKTGEYKNQTSTYTGLTSMTFKKRLYGHKNAIKDKTAGQTRLSAFIHELIEDEIEYEISWKILETAKSYDGRSCQLCLAEKTRILFSEDPNMLNKRTELLGTCRHLGKWTFDSGPTIETQPD